MSVFGDNVARLRTEKGLSQRALAKSLGISAGTVAAWETKGTIPNAPTMKKLQNVLGTTAGHLFTEYLPNVKDGVNDLSYGRVGVYDNGMPISIEMQDASFGYPCPAELLRRYPKAFYLHLVDRSTNYVDSVLPHGSYALVDPSATGITANKIYYVRIGAQEARVARVCELANGMQLLPDSTDPTKHACVYDFALDDTPSVTIVGRVVWYTIPFDFDL